VGIVAVPSCSHPPLPVHIVGISSQQQYGNRTRPYATIVVQVDQSGHVTGSRIDDSSGDPSYDAAAEKAIESWTFLPAKDACKTVAGTAEYAVGQFQETTLDNPCEQFATALYQAEPDFPDSMVRRIVGQVTVATDITIDSVGRVMDAKITSSSGYPVLDANALRAALQSQYFPKIQHCLPVSGTYRFRVTFDPSN
jgi:TonB family protein